MADWKWNEKLHRYQDAETGKFISRTYAMGLIELSIRQAINVSDTLSGYVSSGAISRDDWVKVMREEIKREYIRQYMAAVGGRSQMSKSDWGKIGSMLKNQYQRLDAFSAALPNLSEAQIKMRASMYFESAGQANAEGKGRVIKEWGADTAQWFVNPTLENCDVCLERQGMGPRPIGPRGGFMSVVDGEVFPKDCSSPCLTKDGCWIEYSNSKTGEVYEEGEVSESRGLVERVREFLKI